MINKHFAMTKYQSGVVLIISLIILLALTLIGVTSSSVTGLEEKMAANSKDKNLAFQAAEATLRSVENNLATKPTFDYTAAYSSQGISGLYSLVDSSGILRLDGTGMAWAPFYPNVDWYSTTKVATYNNVTTSGKKLVGLSRPPAYIIEEINSIPLDSSGNGGSLEAGISTVSAKGEVATFRITAHGWGSNNSVATLQSIVKVTYQ